MAYNFSNTYKQPIEKFSMPEGGGGITGLLSGLSSGYAAGKNMKARNKENKTFKEDFMAMIGTEPTQEEIDMNLRNRGIRPGNFVSDFTGAALGAEGVGKMAKNPLLREQVQNIQLGNQRQQQENTLFDQLTRDAGGMVQDFSNLSTTEERLNFLKNNAGKTLTREGAQLMNQFAQITQQLAVLENKSEAALIAHEQRKKKADIAARYGEYTPENEIMYNTDKSLEEIQRDLGRDNVLFSELPDGVIDERGFINRQRFFNWKGNLQREQLPIRTVPTTEFERNLQRVKQLERLIPAVEFQMSQAADQTEHTELQKRYGDLSDLREELKLRRERMEGRSTPVSNLPPELRARYLAEQKKIMAVGGDDMQSQLAELDARYGQNFKMMPPAAVVKPPSVVEKPILGTPGKTYRVFQ